MSLTLIGSPISPFVRKVAVVLIEKGIAYESEQVNPFAPPEGFRDISPLGRIPALRDGDRIINDSSVICRYLDRLHPTPPFYPEDVYDSARAEWIEEYIDGGLVPVTGPGIFGALVLRPMLMGAEPDEAGAQKVIDEELPSFFSYLEAQLGDAEFFVGESISIADVSVATAFVNLRLAGVRPEKSLYPKLNAFLGRLHGRDSFQQLITPVVEGIGKRWVELD